MENLKTLNDFKEQESELSALLKDMKTNACKIFKNLQTKDTIYPLLLKSFPDECKGSYATDLWGDSKFRYGAEYGMLAILWWLFDIKYKDL